MPELVNLEYIGKGIYTISEVARFTQSQHMSVRNWICKNNAIRGIIESEFGINEGIYNLSFLDLIEILTISKLRNAGVSLQFIRKVHQKMQFDYKTTHPFATKHTFTDGKGIWIDEAKKSGEQRLLDAWRDQYEADAITRPFLKDIEYTEAGISRRWWPLGKKDLILIDPNHSFGQPILIEKGVPTYALACTVEAENSIQKAASWYDVSAKAAKCAFKWETEYTGRVKKRAA